MSIFATLEEAQRVHGIIAEHKDFPELKPEHMNIIRCMYDCLRDIENTIDDYSEEDDDDDDDDDDVDVENNAVEALEDAWAQCVGSIAEIYVSITENDEDYWEKDEEEP